MNSTNTKKLQIFKYVIRQAYFRFCLLSPLSNFWSAWDYNTRYLPKMPRCILNLEPCSWGANNPCVYLMPKKTRLARGGASFTTGFSSFWLFRSQKYDKKCSNLLAFKILSRIKARLHSAVTHEPHRSSDLNLISICCELLSNSKQCGVQSFDFFGDL